MSTIIAQPCSTAGNGGRKLIRLVDGTLMTVLRDSTSVQFYTSKDNGATWQLDATMGISVTGMDVSIVPIRVNEVGFLYSYASEVRFRKVTRVGGKFAIGATDLKIDTGQNQVGNVSLAIDPTNGHLHAAWASKNGTYPNSFNIRYAKSADGGVTWSAVEQVSNYNQSTDYALTNPTIVVKNGHPLIVADHSYGSTYKGILAFTTTFTDKAYSNFNAKWGNKVVFSGASYVQSYPSAVVDKDGVIHVVWQGLDATDTVKENIRYSKSIDNGVSWDVIKLTSGNTYSNYQPSISVDKSGKVVVVYSGVDTAISTSRDNIRARYLSGGIWSSAITLTSNTSNNAIYPSVLYDPFFSGNFGTVAPTIYQNAGLSVEYIGTYTTNNAPTVTLSSPTNNQTLYENDTLNISGNAYDSDKDQSVTAYYQINSEPRKVLATNLSQTQIALSKQLTFKGGKLYDVDTVVTDILADGIAHTLKVWAVDNEGAQSIVESRVFYVVPNRAPLLTVNNPTPSGVIDSDSFSISGTYSDPDSNVTTVVYRINGGNSVQIAQGISGDFTFDVTLGSLQSGVNAITIEATDSYGAKTTKTVKLNKSKIATPITRSTVRYKVAPPSGTASEILVWVQRDANLTLDASVSMTLSGEAESFTTMTKNSTTTLPNGKVEDEFYHQVAEAKDSIILKFDLAKSSAETDAVITLITGVF